MPVSGSVLSPSILPYPDFFQDAPRLGNAFTEDSHLQAILRRVMQKRFAEIEQDLTRFGRFDNNTHTEGTGQTKGEKTATQ